MHRFYNVLKLPNQNALISDDLLVLLGRPPAPPPPLHLRGQHLGGEDLGGELLNCGVGFYRADTLLGQTDPAVQLHKGLSLLVLAQLLLELAASRLLGWLLGLRVDFEAGLAGEEGVVGGVGEGGVPLAEGVAPEGGQLLFELLPAAELGSGHHAGGFAPAAAHLLQFPAHLHLQLADRRSFPARHLSNPIILIFI